jgi:ligand-binding sensor domain-containing protein/two-component sensor histidine kinase
VFICVYLWITIFFSTTYSQNLHQWGNIGLFHGLPSEKVHAITQTNDGLFWFGTENGLAKFDGRRVQTIQIPEVTQIFSLEKGGNNSLFIGTNNGLFRLQNEKIELIGDTKSEQVNDIFSAEKTYFVTQSGKLFEVAENSAQNLVSLDIPINSVVAQNEKIYLATEGRGLIEYVGDLKKDIKTPYFINQLSLDKNNSLWLASRAKSTDNGLFNYSEEEKLKQVGTQFGTVSSIFFDEDNKLWLGMKENGVWSFQNDQSILHYTFENTSGGLRSNQIFTVFVDKENVIWFGTDKGVCRFDKKSPFNQMLSEDTNSNFVRALYQTQNGKIFIGTNKGLYVFEGENLDLDENNSEKSVYAVGENTENQVIIGTSADNVRSIQNFNGKTYLAIFGKGLFENEKLIYNHDSILSLYQNQKKLYLGTAKDGILEFSDGKITALNLLTNEAIWAIAGNRENGLWIATEKGLHLWQNGEIKTFLENNTVRSLLLKDNEIYAGTKENGLFIGKFDEEVGWIFSNLNVEQGLAGASVFALLNLGNNILIGTNRGVSTYSPNKITPSIMPNRIISEKIYSAKEIIEGIKLDYPQSTLSVEVIGLSSRTFPESFQYRYLLKNSKGETVLKKLTKDSQIAFENLKPDDYSAEIFAFNQDLLKSEPFKFTFSVGKAPFPWTSTALGILLLIALVALVIVIIERKQISNKNKEIAAARFDLANEAERERRRIAQDLHDQTLADLRELMLKSDKLEGETIEFRNEIESVSDEIRRICEDLSPSVLENVGLTAALEFLLSHSFENYKFLCPEDLEERLNFPSNVQMQIYRIAQEVLNNIKRHAEANFVGMKISDGEVFKLIIENDGKPFLPDFENLPKGRGISNIKSRAELIEAQISWENSEDGKTIFTLQK